MKIKRFVWLVFTMIGLGLLISGCGEGKEEKQVGFPSDPIKIIVPFKAGGASDITTRIVAENAEKHLPESIELEYREGGGGSAGQAIGAAAKPNGYTLTVLTPSVITSPLTTKTPYSLDSFEPVVLMCWDDVILFARNTEPFNSLDSLLTYAKDNPGQVSIGNVGALTNKHLAALAFEKGAGLKLNHVPFNGGSEQRAALLGGHVDLAVGSLSEYVEFVKEGTVAMVCSMGEERHKDYPDVPTLTEKGIDVVEGTFRGLAAPKGTPEEVLQVLEDAFLKAIQDPETQQAFIKSDIPLNYGDRAKFKSLLERSYNKYKELIEEYNLSKSN